MLLSAKTLRVMRSAVVLASGAKINACISNPTSVKGKVRDSESVIEALSWLERFAVRFIQGKITMVHWHKSTPRNVAYFLENGTLIFV